MYAETMNTKKEVLSMANTTKVSVPTRMTTGKVRLTYAFLWEPRKSSDDSPDQDGGEKYSCSLLIPKGDQATLAKYQAALQHAILLGEKKGYWQANRLPSNLKLPIRDGDQECAEKGEEYAGHWFLNASSARKPHIVDLNRNDIFDPSEVYSGCYARVCINLYPFNKKGNRGIACGLEAVQKVADGELLGTAPVSIEEAFGDDEGLEDVSQGGYMPQQPSGFVTQQAAAAPSPNNGQPYPQPAGFMPQQPPMMQPPGGVAPQQATVPGMVQSQQIPYPQQMGAVPNAFARGLENANSALPPFLFEEGRGKQVA